MMTHCPGDKQFYTVCNLKKFNNNKLTYFILYELNLIKSTDHPRVVVRGQAY